MSWWTGTLWGPRDTGCLQYFERDANIRKNRLQLAANTDSCLQDLITRSVRASAVPFRTVCRRWRLR